jgi:methylated-DNA-[protein]-cysteine S-methyltransferase
MVYTTYYPSPVGVLRISSTEHYLSEVHFLNEAPLGAPVQLNPLLESCVAQLGEYFQGLRRTFDLPMRQTGSDFQRRVWEELILIPYGRTISYMDLAKRLGDPKSIRAAASTNGKNQLAILVPCHRVIGANNDLVGYGGGLWRKRWLLEHENKIAYGVQTLF